MLIIAGTFKLDPSKRQAFIADAASMIAASAKEDGCYRYTFCIDPVDDSLVQVYERWESQEHLQAHIATEHSKVWNETVAPKYDFTKDIMKYRIDKVSDILEWD